VLLAPVRVLTGRCKITSLRRAPGCCILGLGYFTTSTGKKSRVPMMDVSGLGEAASIDPEEEQTSLLAIGAQESSASSALLG
jgi:hypothetical protein